MAKELPKWAMDEIKTVKFGNPEKQTRTGYILDIYEEKNEIDAQLYEEVEDGRRIIPLVLPDKIKPSELMKGVVYEFTFNTSKAPLSKKLVEFLQNEKGVDMDTMYQFELTNLELMDVGSDVKNETEVEE